MTTKDSKNSTETKLVKPDLKPPKPRKALDGLKSRRKTNLARVREQKSDIGKQLLKEKIKVTKAKRNLTRAKNNIKRIVKDDENLISEVGDEIVEEIKQDNDNVDVLFKPNDGPQTDFLAASEDEVFYGGARGGGKTYSLIIDPLRYCDNPNHSALLIRRTIPELRDIIHESHKIYKRLYPKANFKQQEKVWYFPSGARIEFGYAENAEDAERYRGRAYNWIGVDELPQYADDSVYNLLKSSLRTSDPTLPTHLRSTGNPGNIGSLWVKKKFIDPAPVNTRFTEENEIHDIVKKEKRIVQRTLRYIPAKVWDNPYLLHDDSYISALASLPEEKRRQMLEGDWDVLEGSAFSEFDRDVHVIEPFVIPSDWPRFRAADWGYSSPFCCLWFAVDFDDTLFAYREYYGHNVVADDWARELAQLERKEKIWYGVIDGSTAINRGEVGPSIYETINFELKKLGRPAFRFADRSAGSRIAGKQEVHKRLAVREIGLKDNDGNMMYQPSLFIFNTCTNLIRTLPMLVTDKNDPEKVAKDQEDHAYDALHYGLRSRPMSPLHIYKMNEFRSLNKFNVSDPVFGY